MEGKSEQEAAQPQPRKATPRGERSETQDERIERQFRELEAEAYGAASSEPWRMCPDCKCERTDYEGEPDKYLEKCPNCGSKAAPVIGAVSSEPIKLKNLKMLDDIHRVVMQHSGNQELADSLWCYLRFDGGKGGIAPPQPRKATPRGERSEAVEQAQRACKIIWKLGEELAAEREQREQAEQGHAHYRELFEDIRQAVRDLTPTDATKKEIIDCVKSLVAQLLAALAAIEVMRDYKWSGTVHQFCEGVLAGSIDALREHDDEVLKPLVEMLREIQPSCKYEDRVKIDAALESIEDGKS